MKCVLNIVGLTSIEYVSLRGVASFHLYPKLDGTLGGNLNLKEGYGWKVLSYLTLDSDKRFWEESQQASPSQNDLYENKVADIIIGDLNRVQLDDMCRDKYLVRFETQNGSKFLLGNMEYPLSFKVNFGSQKSNYPAEFFNRQPHKALIWNYE